MAPFIVDSKEIAYTIDPDIFVDHLAWALVSLKSTPQYPLRVLSRIRGPENVQGQAHVFCDVHFKGRYTDPDGLKREQYGYRAHYHADSAHLDIDIDAFHFNILNGLAMKLREVDPTLYNLSDRLRASLINKGLFVFPAPF